MKKFFSSIFYSIKHIFKKSKPRVRPPVNNPSPSEISPSDNGSFVVAIIEGHSWRDMGATAYNEKNEKTFNNLVQQYVFDNYLGKITLVTEDRPEGLSYKAAVRWLAKICKGLNVDLAIELHNNSANVESARGNHKRIAYGDKESLSFANLFNDIYLKMFPFATLRRRHMDSKGVFGMKKRDAGYWFTYYMSENGIASMLDEPFFFDFKNEESEPFMEGDGYKKLGDYWIKCLYALEKELNL